MKRGVAHELGWDGRRLTDEEELSLSIRARAGDMEARKALVASQAPLATSKAAKYACPMVPVDDLVQEAMIGLMRATETFDPGKHGVRFSSYAIWWVMRGIFEAIEDMGGVIRVPQYVQRLGPRIARAEAEIRARGEEIDDAEVARVCRISESRLAKYRHFRSLGFLDSSARDHGLVMESIAAPESPEDDTDEAVEGLRTAMGRLTEVESYILRRRFGIDCPGQSTATEVIAGEFGMSRKRISDIEHRAIHRLRKILAA